MHLSRSVAPSALVSTAEAKAHLRVEHSEHDTLIDNLVSAATELLDGSHGYLRRALVTQTWVWSLPDFPIGAELHIPLPPLQSVSSITYYDANDASQTLSSSEYHVYPADPSDGYVKLKRNSYWPLTYERDDAVTVTFVAGYGAASSVPKTIRQAVLMRVANMYSFAGDTVEGQDKVKDAVSDTEARLLAPHRVLEFMAAHRRHWRRVVAQNW